MPGEGAVRRPSLLIASIGLWVRWKAFITVDFMLRVNVVFLTDPRCRLR